MQQTFHEQLLANTGSKPKDTVLFQESAGIGFISHTVLRTWWSVKLINPSVALSILVFNNAIVR